MGGMAALAPYIIPGAVAGAGVSTLQKKDPAKGALYGAGTGGIGAAVVGSTPKEKGTRLAPLSLLSTAPSSVPMDVKVLEKDRARRRQRLRRTGRQGTILTEGGLGEPAVKRATLLGGSE